MGKTIVGRTTENVALLPRWAQKRIARLATEVEEWKKQAYGATTPGKTNVTLVDQFLTGDEQGLPPNARVRFAVAGTFVEVGHSRSHEGEAIEVRSLDGALSILPSVTNVIYVKVNRR